MISPATSSPSHATCQRVGSSSGSAKKRSKSPSTGAAWSQWSRKASSSASQIARCCSWVTGRSSSPSGSRRSGIGSPSGRRISKWYRYGAKPRAVAKAAAAGTLSGPAPPSWWALSVGPPVPSAIDSRARASAQARSRLPRPRRRCAGWTHSSTRWLTTAGRSRQLCRASPTSRPSSSTPCRSRSGRKLGDAVQSFLSAATVGNQPGWSCMLISVMRSTTVSTSTGKSMARRRTTAIGVALTRPFPGPGSLRAGHRAAAPPRRLLGMACA